MRGNAPVPESILRGPANVGYKYTSFFVWIEFSVPNVVNGGYYIIPGAASIRSRTIRLSAHVDCGCPVSFSDVWISPGDLDAGSERRCTRVSELLVPGAPRLCHIGPLLRMQKEISFPEFFESFCLLRNPWTNYNDLMR
jgi:hypothetical protein